MKKLLFALPFVLLGDIVCADEYNDLIARRNALKQQIEATDSEISRCEKSLKGWTAATIIGGIGAVATGVGAIVQNQQSKEIKQAHQNVKEETKAADAIININKKVQ